MTEFITGTSGSGKGGYIVSRIKERLGSGRKMYLIVPEQQALLWEARICRALPPSAALELEVLSFRRLADTVFRTYGGQNTVFSGKADRLINMWRAVTSVKSSLKHYAGADGHEEKYVPLLLETLSDLKARGVSVESLAEAERELIRETARELSKLPTVFYSGHCTGLPAYELMKEIMGGQLLALHTGCVIDS